ncbi:MAG TPA: DUF2203 domain-containing protein [Bryobacteraceae bacterium]|nr:DUF2203 domain-containing protein [Bryobacteraceae bacterium]
MPKRFTLAEAERLIPSVDRLLRQAIKLKTAYSGAERRFESYQKRILLMGGVVVDRSQVREDRERRDEAAAALRTVFEEVQQLGCLIKDLDTGLVDFPTLFQGREVYLCWKLGEPAIAFWHSVDEGFAGRKAIDLDFRQHHQGDPPQ